MTIMPSDANNLPTNSLSFWRRLRHTPLRDLLMRRRITGRKDVEAILASYQLPASCTDVVRRVVKKSRLWRLEKAQVAAELAAHFRDGLDEGVSDAELVKQFGDPVQAAKLIRRAKKRNRSLLWQIQRRTFQALGVFVLLYVAMVGYAYFQSPSITVNYLHEFNASSEKVAEPDRAWPVYREAARQLGMLADPDQFSETFRELCDSVEAGKPLSPQQQQAWIKDYAPALALLRQAAAKPALGFVHRTGKGPEDLPYASSENDPVMVDPYAKNEPLFGVRVPYANFMRVAARLLTADAQLALGENDLSRASADWRALDGIAQHGEDNPMIVCALLGLNVRDQQLKSIGHNLAKHPEKFTDQALLEIAHRLARWDLRAPMKRAYKGERLMFADFVQRIYSDDGHGNGRITPEGIEIMREAMGWNLFAAPPIWMKPPSGTLDALKFETQWILAANGKTLQQTVLTAGMPVLREVMADRQDVVSKYDQFMSRNEALLPQKAYLTGDELNQIDQSLHELDKTRYALLKEFLPALGGASRTCEISEVARDGVLLGIALELFHRKAGRYPETLAELSPRYLPEIPVDPMNGEPLKYRVTDQGPLVYSIGRDRKDDGGVSPADPRLAQNWSARLDLLDFQGDWVLWPMPR